MFKKAAKKNTPNIFPGDANLFRSTNSKSNLVLSWKEFIAGKTEDHTLTCGHLDIFEEPHDSVFAEKLNRVLLQAYDNLKNRT